MSTDTNMTIVSWIWKVAVISLAYFLGTMISGAVITVAGMPWPAFPNQPSQSTGLLLNLVGSVLMGICLALLASGIRGSRLGRCLALAAFSYVIFGLNNQIEAAAFTSFGGTATMLVFFVVPCLLAAAVAAWLLRPAAERQPLGTVFTHSKVARWPWRIVLAWLAFPAIYIFFGMLVAPIVVPFYQDPSFGLRLPGWGALIPVVLLRSALALAVTLPILLLWSRSRRSLLVALAVAFFAMMGLIGLATTTFFPPAMRIAHSLEILGDSVVYAWVLVALFMPKARAAGSAVAPANAG